MKVLLYNRDDRMHQGGDMIQVRAYEKWLNTMGVEATYHHSWDLDLTGFDLANLFHINFGWTWKHYMNCKKYNIPYVISAIFYPFEQGDMDKSMMIEVIEGSRKIMFLSHREANECKEFLNYQIPDNKVVVLNNGVDKEFVPEGEIWDGAKDYVLTVGRWERGKGQKRVVEACKELGLPVVAMGSLGDLNYRNECLDVYPEAHILEAVPHSDMPKYYRGAKVYVCSSETERHNLCLMEAAACGCNLVSSTENRGNEWYEDGLAISNPYKPEQLASIIKTEYEKEREGRWSHKIPTWEAISHSLVDIYTSALENG